MQQELSPQQIQTLQELFSNAIAQQNSGELEQSIASYQRILQLSPNSLEAQHNLAIVQLHHGDMKPALASLEALFIEYPGHPGMQGTAKQVGLVLYQKRYWEAAIPWLLKAVDINPDDQECSWILTRIAPRDYLQQEYYDEAEQRTLLRYAPRESESYIYTIDIVGTCNLRCPSCPVGNSMPGQRFTQLMAKDMFDAILEKISHESPVEKPQIWLYNWGEPLLHPELSNMIKTVKSYGFSCHLSSNLNIEKGLKDLVKAGPEELKISLSGFTQENYQQTHSKGNLLLVKSNLYKIRQYMDSYKSTMRVWVSHHIYKHNAHEADAVKSLCQELGFEYHSIQAFYQPLEKLMAIAEGDEAVLAEPILQNLLVSPVHQIQFSQAHQQADYDCELRFNQTVINADGSVAQCCSQYDAANNLGIEFLSTEHKSIESKKYQSEFCKKCRSLALDYSPKAIPISLRSNA